MKPITAIAIFLTLLAPAFAQTSGSGSATPAGTAAQQMPPLGIARSGSQPSGKGPAEFFTGNVRVDPLFRAVEPSRTSGAYVTFEPGARSAWHTHPYGQVLIVTAGVGWVQRWGGPVEEMRAGDVVRIAPGQKHWHGAAPTTSVTHLAIQEQQDGKTVDWLEKVSDAQYNQRP